MTLPLSGTLSFDDVNIELGKSLKTLISLNDSTVRSLASKSALTQISVADLYGKVNLMSSWIILLATTLDAPKNLYICPTTGLVMFTSFVGGTTPYRVFAALNSNGTAKWAKKTTYASGDDGLGLGNQILGVRAAYQLDNLTVVVGLAIQQITNNTTNFVGILDTTTGALSPILTDLGGTSASTVNGKLFLGYQVYTHLDITSVGLTTRTPGSTPYGVSPAGKTISSLQHYPFDSFALMVGHYVSSDGTGIAGWIGKIDPSAGVLWNRYITIPSSITTTTAYYTQVSNSCCDNAGNLYIRGIGTYTDLIGAVKSISYIMKVNSAGTKQWVRLQQAQSTYNYSTSAMSLCIDGSILIVSKYKLAADTKYSLEFTWLDSNGATIKTKSLSSASTNSLYLHELEVDTVGNLYASCTVYASSAQTVQVNKALLKLPADGSLSDGTYDDFTYATSSVFDSLCPIDNTFPTVSASRAGFDIPAFINYSSWIEGYATNAVPASATSLALNLIQI